MIAPAADLFDVTTFAPMGRTVIRRSAMEPEPRFVPASLFDFPTEAGRRRKLDLSAMMEEDVERWDGLS
jgi:hypothetical protein